MRKITTKTELARQAVIIQRSLCVYDVYSIGMSDRGPPSMCDCKYGLNKVGRGTEEGNGCPEMREIVAVLNEMSAKEYKAITDRILVKTQRRVQRINSMTKKYLKKQGADIA